MVHQPLLNDHAANRMPDQDRPGGPDLLQELLQRIGEAGNADARQRCRSTVARHVPRNGAIAVAKEIQLAAPSACRAADSMQKHQRRRRGVAGGLEAETTIAGFHGM